MTTSRRLTVLLLTYKRLDYAKITLSSTLDNLKFSGEIAVHIADDGSGGKHIETLRNIAGGYDRVVAVGHSDSNRGGYGKNFNLATQVIHPGSDFVLPIEDDWRLTRTLDADRLCGVLEAAPTKVGCLRLGYLGFTDEIRGRIERINGETLFIFDPASPEKHVFAGHPRLETVAWEKHVGPWPEGLAPGATELVVCSNPFSRQGVAWPLDTVAPEGDLFVHIGTKRSTDD